ncbi:MAG: 30S ribosomal protein S3 [Armatimonadetes bacterium]|nr:30S ribosomal protein S3 [Armatimonadota bacterium]
MGQKIHPIGFRIGVIRDWESKWYANKKEFAALLQEDMKIRKFIQTRLKQAAISHIEIERAANRAKITLHTGKPGIIIGRGGRGIDELRATLDRLTQRQLTINVIEIRQPETDAQLVAEGIGAQLTKRISHKRAMRQAVTRAMRMGAKGVRILCAGRLAGSEMARRELDRMGKIPLQTLRANIDYGFAEAMTTYGHIGIKVWIYKGDILPDMRRTIGESAEEAAAPRPPRPRSERGDRNRRRSRNANAKKGQAPQDAPRSDGRQVERRSQD